jgi:NDP-sugar pyrophosphorylase family protein
MRSIHRVIIQAGGLGTRLHPYTTVLPKPLVPVGELPILEIMIRQLVARGFYEITITLGHLGHLIMAVVGDGERLGAQVDYVWEKQPRGTIGAVTLVDGLDEPFLVTNGDLLTDFDYRRFMGEHCESGAMLSVGTYHKRVQISLGVFDLDLGRRITGFREKPTLSLPCSMGIYAVDPSMLELIPSDRHFGFDDLMKLCLEQKLPVRAHMFEGHWLDIGRIEDHASASETFAAHREAFLPEIEPAPARPRVVSAQGLRATDSR